MPTISAYKLIHDMNGGAEQVQHDMVADQRNYGWNYDAAHVTEGRMLLWCRGEGGSHRMPALRQCARGP